MRRALTIATTIGAAALVATSLGATAMAAGNGAHPQARAAHAGKASGKLDHVFVLMLENHSKSSVIGNKNAPYITSLARTYTMADHYYGVTHPSMPNYIAAIAGDNFGIQDDNDQNVLHLNRRNLVDQLEAHHIGWGAYMQDLPANKTDRFGPTVNGTQVSLYAKKHNPFVLFDDVKNNPARMAKVKDYSNLAADLAKKNAPQFVWISPNQCNDMHGGVYATVPGHAETPCPYGDVKDDANDAALKHKADAFVHSAVRTIRSSKAWTKHSAIVIVTDENDYTGTSAETGNASTGGWESAAGCCDSPFVSAGDPRVSASWPGGTYGGGRIPAIIVGSQSKGGHVDHTRYNHYSLLTTIEQNWNLAYLGHTGDSAGGVHPRWKSFLG